MSDFTNDLASLADDFDEAVHVLSVLQNNAEACHRATVDYDHEGRPTGEGWKEMGEFERRLFDLLTQLRTAMPESIRKASNAAADEIDHYADMADANSY